jgi:L-lactate utilization protein LutC
MGKHNQIQSRVAFRQSDITRAIKAAKAAGMTVATCEISRDGAIVISEGPSKPLDPLEAWKVSREGRA